MKIILKDNKWSKLPEKLAKKYKQLSEKFSSFFSDQEIWVAPDDYFSAHFEVQNEKLDKDVWTFLINRILLYHTLGYQVTVEPLPEQKESEVFGYLSLMGGEKLEYRAELRIQTESIEKKTIDFHPIFETTPPDVEVDSHNVHLKNA